MRGARGVTPALAAGTVALALLLAGCGGGEESGAADPGDLDAYCALVGDVSQRVQEKLNAFEDPTPLLEEAADVAPPEVREHWDALIAGYRAYIEVLTEDLVDQEDPPEGVTPEEAAATNMELLTEVTEEQVAPTEDDAAAIKAHADEACPA